MPRVKNILPQVSGNEEKKKRKKRKKKARNLGNFVCVSVDSERIDGSE